MSARLSGDTDILTLDYKSIIKKTKTKVFIECINLCTYVSDSEETSQ